MNILLLLLIASFSCTSLSVVASEIETDQDVIVEEIQPENDISIEEETIPDIDTQEELEILTDEDAKENLEITQELSGDVSGEALSETEDVIDTQEDTSDVQEDAAVQEDLEISEEQIEIDDQQKVEIAAQEELITEETTPIEVIEEEEIITEPSQEIESITKTEDVLEETEPTTSLELSEPLGIDTMDLSEPQGNWLFKRVWWERAEERYEKINQLVQKMMEMRVNFFVKRADIDKKILDPFYLNIGMGHAELLVTLTTMIEQVEKERQDEGTLSFEQRELLETLEQERDAVTLLQKDVQAIQELDHSVDSALAKLIEIMNEMRQHERNAWVNFKEIARVLSEKKARELFYNIDASWQHIKKLRDYLEKDFGPYFAKLAKSVNEHIDVVQKQIDELDTKGVDLKQSVDILTQQKKLLYDDYEDEDDDEEEPIQTSWLSWFGNLIWSIITFPITLIKQFFGLFF